MTNVSGSLFTQSFLEVLANGRDLSARLKERYDYNGELNRENQENYIHDIKAASDVSEANFDNRHNPLENRKKQIANGRIGSIIDITV